jgi:hypothetical protein
MVTKTKPDSSLRKPFKPLVAWTYEQQNILRAAWGKDGMTLAKIGRMVGKSPAAVRKVAITLGLHNGTDNRFKGSEFNARTEYGERTGLPQYVVIAQDGMFTEFVCGSAGNAFSASKAMERHNGISQRKAGVYVLLSDEQLAEEVDDVRRQRPEPNNKEPNQ